MTPGVKRAVEAALGGVIERVARVSGGDINDAHRAELRDGRTVFVKSNEGSDPAMFPAEASGLAFLAEAEALRIPRVLAVSSADARSPSFLALEYLEPGRPAPGFDERLGRGLAALHRFGAPGFGLSYDNFIGRLSQSNRAHAAWADFYREERLAPQLRLAEDRGLASTRMKQGLDRLLSRISEVVGPEEPPSRLHGDLWGGNLHTDARGEPVLVDPAVHGGHREVDLAMMRLFGGFAPHTFDAYGEAYPLADGHEDRIALYQLYPLLVHVNLFGGSYVSAVERALHDCG